MSQFFITCKESRIENHRSFYSSFFLGPFDPSESLTVANALRRTLLSELPGIAITSVEIEGVSHEYSNLPGIRDSVLDILLNMKEIVLKKLVKNMRPQIGYLRVRGPGIIRARDLRLPPFIQCVDPEQYIATLAEDGFLNIRFIIDEGKNYMKSHPKTNIDVNQFKKRRLILKKINELCNSNPSILKNFNKVITKKNKINTKYFLRSKSFFKQEQILNAKTKKTMSLDSINKSQTFKLLNVDPVFNPINKVNYIIEVNEHKIVEKAFEKSNIIENSYEILNASSHPSFQNDLNNYDSQSTNLILNKLNSFVEKPVLRYFENLLNYKTNLARLKNRSLKMTEVRKKVQQPINLTVQNLDNINQILGLKNQIVNTNHDASSIDLSIMNPSLKTEGLKHNITLEIWTNGSLHPREAMYQAFKHLVMLFSKLKKIKILNQMFKSDRNYINFIQKINDENFDLIPLNQNNFLGKYANLSTTNSSKFNSENQKSSFTKSYKKTSQYDSLKSNNLAISLNSENNFNNLKNVDISELSLSLRTYTCLKRFNINTLEDLLLKSKKDLFKIPNLSKKSVEEIEKNLFQKGFNLAN